MHKPDIAIVVLGLLAIAATGTGVAKSDDWTGERTYRFTGADVPLPGQGPTAAGSAPARLEWEAPDNATAAALLVTVAFTGQAVQGGNAVVKVSGTAPDGSQLPVQTRTIAIAPGATEATATFPYNATWAQTPGKVRDTQPPAAIDWAQPLVVLVAAERPGDLPAATYTFTAGATGTAAVFTAS